MHKLGRRAASGLPGQFGALIEVGIGSIYCPPMPNSDPHHAPLGVLDERAVSHVLARMAAGDQVPWLHRETARRMAERLPIILRAPAR
jgi:hypothetical protein